MSTPSEAIAVDNHLRRDRCPLCGAAVESAGVMRLPPAIPFSSHWISPQRPPELWRCVACGSAFTQYAIPEDVAMGLYGSGDGGARWGTDQPFTKTHTRETLAALQRIVRPGMRVLDVGCNTGDLLDYARGLGAVTAGVEPSDASRKVAADKGHRMVASLAEAVGPFDVVTAFDVVEHLYELPTMLDQIASLLPSGGRLIALTGDITCRASKNAGAGWWYVQCPEHVIFPTLTALGGMKGWSVEESVTTFAATSHEPRLFRRLLMGLTGRSRADLHDHILVVMKKG